MVLIFNIQFLLLFFLYNFQVPQRDLFVKILLYEVKKNEDTTWDIFSEKGIQIISLNENKKSKIYSDITSIHLKNGNIFINSNRLINCEHFLIKPINETFSINDNFYHGSLYFIKFKDSFLLINRINLEEYIYSVLKTESWPGWPLEVNKVLAIACRSYATSKILESKRLKLPYHLKPTNHHQTYSGIHFNEVLRQATDQTAGIIMSYNKKPVLAMFDCCCGGIIPNKIKHLNHKEAPYLSRNYACNFCKECKIFNWNFEISKSELIQKLKNEIKLLKNLHDIKVHFDSAGLVEKILIKEGKKLHNLTGKKLYSLFKEIKSFSFDIKHENNKILFTGKGYGHHIGLCQWGARQMINEGYNYKEILQFYYPETKFVRLKSLK